MVASGVVAGQSLQKYFQSPCSRQWSASSGAVAPPAAHRPAAQSWLAPPQTHTKTGPYHSHVAFPALFQTVEEMRVIAVISVAGHAAMRHPTGLGFIQQRQGKLRFSLKLDGGGDVRLLAPRLIRRPLLWQVQPGGHRPGPRALGIMAIDHDLAVSHLARRPSILARYPDRVTPALLKPRIIKDEHPIPVARQGLQAGDPLAVEGVLVPDHIGQQMIELLLVGFGHDLSQGVAVLVGMLTEKPVRYCRRVSALGPWVKCTRSGAKNSASSGSGARGACGNRACFWALRLIHLGYHRFTVSDKVVLADFLSKYCVVRDLRQC